jgi:alkanesulfonate monooxygenase SsuD/methylene tetrahydromethanopterin reductase-like flavin-dependent oxidoreductase (luciferase family)
LADRAESLGFDSLWGVEHHFNGYAVCPDPLAFLHYFAGRTKHIRLGTMVVVLPWHDPVRIAEACSVLDHISGGRNILGVGRGVAKLEFDGFGLDMQQSRQKLIEATQAVQMGLEKGYIELDGEVIKQRHVQIRPHPARSFVNRIYGSASSPETFSIFAKLGIGLLLIPGGKPWSELVNAVDEYRREFREIHNREAPRPIFVGWTFVDEDADRAREIGIDLIAKYSLSALDHYDFLGPHMKGLRGYEAYAAMGDAAAAAGVDTATYNESFARDHIYGTPDACYERIRELRADLGAAAFLGVFSYSGMSATEAYRNQSLFAEKVLPRLKSLEPDIDLDMPKALAEAAE